MSKVIKNTNVFRKRLTMKTLKKRIHTQDIWGLSAHLGLVVSAG